MTGIGPHARTWEKHCIHCGKRFMATYNYAECCSPACLHKAWRARTMLAGTHGYVGGIWRRLKPTPSEQA